VRKEGCEVPGGVASGGRGRHEHLRPPLFIILIAPRSGHRFRAWTFAFPETSCRSRQRIDLSPSQSTTHPHSHAERGNAVPDALRPFLGLGKERRASLVGQTSVCPEFARTEGEILDGLKSVPPGLSPPSPASPGYEKQSQSGSARSLESLPWQRGDAFQVPASRCDLGSLLRTESETSCLYCTHLRGSFNQDDFGDWRDEAP
jgi:hypothetical protein